MLLFWPTVWRTVMGNWRGWGDRNSIKMKCKSSIFSQSPLLLRIVHILLSLFLSRLFMKTLWLWIQSSNQSNHGIMFWNCWLNLDEVLIIIVYDKMIVCNVLYPCQWRSLSIRGRPLKKSCQKTFFMQWSEHPKHNFWIECPPFIGAGTVNLYKDQNSDNMWMKGHGQSYFF